MKRKLFALFAVFLLCSSATVAVIGSELQGGYYLTGDCALGSGLTFYIPSDFAEGALTYDSSGVLFNLTSSSVYLYCPDYPDYTIYASRFSGFQYRSSSGSGYQYQDLNLRNITATNVQIYSEAPGYQMSENQLLLLLVVFVLLLGLGYFIFPKG